ncbi:molybdenum cofactor biosynthesis protein MoaE [Cucumibacter marinus]|uniref:molybdenum cofactor biosynthesis protein MoaE n=1 Tax=Cucumibacter marinus TaxID=1121252 RepID=UPI0003FE228F|nr:molybdenum cofactor biosynthesis protein MoaE [Cucumibacter marinus]
MPRVRLQAEPFDPGAETNAFLKGREETGAFVSFVGTVRSTPDKPVTSLTLEHYPGMAEAQITRFAEEALERFKLTDIAAIHRFGTMKPGEVIVMVMALSPHRLAAFDGANFVMDWLKTDAPFWKKEAGPQGENWVEAKATDDTARDRWKS